VYLPYSEFQASYRVLAPFRLPHHCGSLLRGVLGRALRSTACTASPTCAASCLQPTGCTYSRLFDPPLPTLRPHKLLRGATHAPPPLLPLIPPPGEVELLPGDSFTFGLRVLGRLDPPHDHHLLRALERLPELGLGRDDGRLAVDSVAHLGPPNRLLTLPPADTTPDSSPTRATITLETPAWIEQNDRLPTTPDFRTLFRNLNRRITSLCALYGELPPDHEDRYRRLDALCDAVTVHASLHPVRWQRHSLERDERHPMKGLLGTLALTGNLAPFVPTLRLAELAHVGKATSHGLGRIRVNVA
jgi:hypothetical protein